MDIEIHEEDVENVDIPMGWEQSTLSPENQAKLAEAMKDDVQAPKGTQGIEQTAEPEITADDIPTEPQPSAGKFKVALPDGEIEVDAEELKKGYMRQQDYTRKTQEAARLRAEAEAMREAMQFYQPEPPVFTPPYPQTIGAPEFQTPTEKMLYDELQTLKSQVGNMSKARETDLRRSVANQIDSELKGFREAHPDLDEERLTRIITIANEEGARPSKRVFERIYKAEFTDAQKIKDEAVAEYIKTLREKKKAAVAPSKEQGNSAPVIPDIRSMSEEQRHAAMLKEMGY